MSTEENKAIVRRFLEELVSTGNPALADELLASNYALHFGGNPPMDGQGFRQFLGMFRAAFPDLRVTVEDEIAEGDKVATRFTWRGTHRGPFQGIAPTGKHVTGSGIAIYRVTNGQIAEDVVQEDTL